MTKPAHSNRQSGVALINALLIVAALSSVALLLLKRSDGARIRQEHAQEVFQTRAYLDAFEVLLISILDADREAGNSDNLKELWTHPNYSVAIDKGQVSGTIRDLQGRFNLNWLGNSEAGFGADEFEQLMQNLGQTDALRQSITDWLSKNGPQDHRPYLNHAPAITPRGGQITFVDELKMVDGMTPDAFSNLSAVITAIPGESVINANTAPAEVLQAFMHKMPPEVLNSFLALRAREPFEKDEELLAWFQQALNEEDFEAAGVDRFSVSSYWFEAVISASLGQTNLTRRVIFQRSSETGKARVAYRLANLHYEID